MWWFGVIKSSPYLNVPKIRYITTRSRLSLWLFVLRLIWFGSIRSHSIAASWRQKARKACRVLVFAFVSGNLNRFLFSRPFSRVSRWLSIYGHARLSVSLFPSHVCVRLSVFDGILLPYQRNVFLRWIEKLPADKMSWLIRPRQTVRQIQCQKREGTVQAADNHRRNRKPLVEGTNDGPNSQHLITLDVICCSWSLFLKSYLQVTEL